MRIQLPALMLLFGISISAYADTYQWVDDKGVVNFTDNLDNVPSKYMKKVKVLPSAQPDQGGAPVSEAGKGSAPPAPSAGVAPNPAPAYSGPTQFGGHDERWWKSSYARLRGEMKSLQDGLPAKRAELETLHRKLIVYTYARNREAYQSKLAEVQRDEARIKELNEQLANLDSEATRAGVPFNWRK
jgi:hypothetical protein